MKRIIPLLTAVLLAVGAPTIAAPQYSSQIKAINGYIQANDYGQIQRRVEGLLKSKDFSLDKLSAEDRRDFAIASAYSSVLYDPANYAAAKATFEEILTDPSLSNIQRIEILNTYTNVYLQSLNGEYLDRMDTSPAHEILGRALKLPGLQPEEKALALQNIGSLYNREDKDHDALKYYNEALKLQVSAGTEKALWRSIANVHVKRAIHGDIKQGDEAVAIYRDQGFDLISLYKRIGRFDEATALLRKTLDDPKASDLEKWDAFSGLPAFRHVSPRNNTRLFNELTAEIQTLSKEYLPALLKEDPDRASILFDHFNQASEFRNTFYGSDSHNPQFIVWAGKYLLEAPRLSGNKSAAAGRHITVFRKYTNALIATNQLTEAGKALRSAKENERLDPPTRFWAGLTLAGLNDEDTDTIISSDKTLPDGARATEVLAAGQSVLQVDEKKAKVLYASYQKLIPQLPQATVGAPFVKKVPVSVEGWIASPLYQDKKMAAKLDRPYGDNLKQLLAADAASGERGQAEAASKKTGDRDTDLFVAVDADGIHLFLDAKDDRADEIVKGTLRGGSIEMYFGPGKNQPYYFMLPGFPDRKILTGPSTFNTMYPNANPGWRFNLYDNSSFTSDVRPIDGGFGVALFYSWDLFYDRLPSRDNPYVYEGIRFTRSGGFSFGGSQSVHNSSSWGLITFNGLTEENLAEIKTKIIYNALNHYKEIKKGAQHSGPVALWQDKELGDPAFYESRIAPALARLDAYIPLVNDRMTPETVETLYEEAVPGWFEIEYNIDRLRREYLLDKMVKD